MVTSGRPRVLSEELLEELARCWRSVGAPVLDRLRPGLPYEEMDELTDVLGLRLPGEAQRWWGWHDGAGSELGVRGNTELTGAGWDFLSLRSVVSQCQLERASRQEALLGEPAAEEQWPLSWLPLSSDLGGALIVLDCSRPDELITPVLFVDRQVPASELVGSAPRVPSLGELVCWWIGAFDAGAYYYNRESAQLECDWDRLDPDRASTGFL